MPRPAPACLYSFAAPAAYGGPVGGLHGGAAGPMVGRDRGLTRVTALPDDAVAGNGRLVLCTGEAGIGKTRLAEEAATSAAAGAWPWRGRAADRDSSRRRVLRPLSTDHTRTEQQESPGGRPRRPPGDSADRGRDGTGPVNRGTGLSGTACLVGSDRV